MQSEGFPAAASIAPEALITAARESANPMPINGRILSAAPRPITSAICTGELDEVPVVEVPPCDTTTSSIVSVAGVWGTLHVSVDSFMPALLMRTRYVTYVVAPTVGTSAVWKYPLVTG